MVAGLLPVPAVIRAVILALIAQTVLQRSAPGLKRRRGLSDTVKHQRVQETLALVKLPSKSDIGELIDDDAVARFLTVCRWDAKKAATLLHQDFAWRQKAKPRSIRFSNPEAGCNGWTVLKRRTRILQMPCTSVQTSEWEPRTVGRSVEQNIRHVAFFMEEMIKRMPMTPGVTGAVMLIDMNGFRMPLLVPYVRDGVMLCQKHYPCRLGAIVAYNLPAIFPLIWKVVSPWFNEDIRSKIVFPPRHLTDESAVLDWLDEQERKRAKPFKQTFAELQSR